MEDGLDETLSRQMDSMQQTNPPAVCLAAFDLLGKLLGNIVGRPEEAKFRAVKKTNKTIQTKLLPCAGVLELFNLLGFTPLEDTLVFLGDDTTVLELALAMVDGRLEELQKAQAARARPPEEAKAAPPKTDYSKLSAEKRRLLEQFEQDRRETALRQAPVEGSRANQLNFGGGKKSCFKDIGVDVNKKGG